MSVDIPLDEGKLKKKGKGLLSSNLVTPLDLPGVFSREIRSRALFPGLFILFRVLIFQFID
jgi:hypothetical protein